MPEYVSYALNAGDETQLATFNDDPSLAFDQMSVVQFALGSPGTGSPVHYHNAAWNGLFYGRKRWFLLPPYEKIISRIQVKKWVDEDVPTIMKKQRMVQCDQTPGDLLYVPLNWAHAVLNVKESVAVAWEGQHNYMLYGMMTGSSLSSQVHGKKNARIKPFSLKDQFSRRGRGS